MSTYTPGPWHVADGSKQLVHAGDVWIASTMGVRGEVGEANARLIAAAPEMREALTEARKGCKLLEDLCACRGDDDYVSDLLAKIDDALAKAGA
jgi:hypothetical protein